MAWLSLLEFTRSFAQITHLNFKDKTKSFVVQGKNQAQGTLGAFQFQIPWLPWLPPGLWRTAPLTPTPSSHCQVTHKVRSLGIWLKLDTGMVVMLLLLSVLKGTDGHLIPAQQGFTGDLSAHIVSHVSCDILPRGRPALLWVWRQRDSPEQSR